MQLVTELLRKHQMPQELKRRIFYKLRPVVLKRHIPMTHMKQIMSLIFCYYIFIYYITFSE